MSEKKVERDGQEEESFFLDGAPEDPAEAKPTKVVSVKKSGGASRSLVLLLLLVVALGGGLYFFGMDMLIPADTPVVTSQPPKASKLKVPVRKKVPSTKEAVTEEVVPEEKVATVTPKKEVVRPAAAVKPKPAPKPASEPAFALTSGGYLYKGSLNRAVQTIEKMGYRVSRSEKPEAHAMIRLLVGHYPRPLAEKRLAEVKKLAEDAFLVAEKGQFAVYAGSYVSQDKARRSADLLYQQGLRVDEKHVEVMLPKTTLRFGGFATRKEADAAALKLKKKGVMAPQVVSIK